MIKKILILEDVETLWSIYKKYLIRAWYEVLWVKTCDEAEETLKIFKPDIIYTDCKIDWDKRSWYDLLPIYREQAPNAYIFMLSNYCDWRLKEKAIKRWANDFFVKINFPPKDFVALIGNLEDWCAFMLWQEEYKKLPPMKKIVKKVKKETEDFLKYTSQLVKEKWLAFN